MPYLVKDQVGSVLKETAKWDTELQNVFFNPYTLALEIEGARILNTGGDSIIEFDAFFVNFNLMRTLTGTISFDEISLLKPTIQLDIDGNGVSNFQKAFASDEKAETVGVKPDNSGPLALFFAAIAISQGQINISDNSQGEIFKVSLQPLNLSLQNFSTANNEGGEYALAISLGKGQSLDWKGQFGIAPLQSKGHLSVNNIRSENFWHYVKNQSPYWLNKALVSFDGDYHFSILDDTTELSIHNASVSLNDVSLAENQETTDLLALNNITISPINFDLQEREVSLGSIILDTPKISLLRYPDNQINILKALQGASEESVKTEETVNTEKSREPSPFKWGLEQIVVKTAQFNWQDQSLTNTASLAVTDINIKLGKISHDLSQAFPYQINFKTDDSVQSFSGNLSPDPFTLNGKLTVTDFPLTWLQSYLSESANIIINSGGFSLKSDYELSQDDFLNAKVSALIRIDQLALNDAFNNKALSGFDHFQVGPVDVQLGRKSGLTTQDISIKEIKLSKPYGEVYVSELGEMNLDQLSTANDEDSITTASTSKVDREEESAATEKTSEIEKPTATGPTIQIDTIEIQEGRFVFTDTSKSPIFNSYLDEVNGTITQLSSNPEEQSRVDISGNLESYGKLQVQGTLNPLSEQPNTDLSIKVSNIDLSTISPYSAQYAGYLIDKGKLDLNLSYNIQGKQLNAENHIFIDQFEFGESVDSEEATSLPLPFAIGMMKNLKGEIDLDLPISGDLDDPSFSLGGVILSAFTNLITKIVTSPFSILGALVEGDDDISSVSFLAASAELTSEQERKVLTLAKALSERPNLNLEVRAVADESIDGPVDLLLLAKERSRTLSRVIIDKGGIEKERIYVLEPQVLKLNNADIAKKESSQISTVLSLFTIRTR